MSTTQQECEKIQRQRLAELAEEDTSRKALEAKYGQVWTSDTLGNDFEVEGFKAPFVLVKRKSDGQQGSLEFTHHPRFYFHWQAYKPKAKRFRDAIGIQQGACNISGIAKTLYESAIEAREAGIEPKEDPAVRLIVHQLMHLTLAWKLNDQPAYGDAMAECERLAAKVAANG